MCRQLRGGIVDHESRDAPPPEAAPAARKTRGRRASLGCATEIIETLVLTLGGGLSRPSAKSCARATCRAPRASQLNHRGAASGP